MTALVVTKKESKPDRLTVTWDPPHPPCAVDYVVEYQLVDWDQCDPTEGLRTPFMNTSDTSVTVTGLEPYSTYRIYVSARNHLGWTENSETGTTEISGENPSYFKVKLKISVVNILYRDKKVLSF